MNVHANLRHIFSLENIPKVSVLKPEKIRGVNFMIVRELLGGSYYGEKGRTDDEAFDTRTYNRQQIEAIGHSAFELARSRSDRPSVTSVDKANVLATSQLWREVMQGLQEEAYSDVALEHMLVDNAAMQLVRAPKQFDVMVTGNIFGDILSDEAS